jgi:hypothetical protein
MAEIKVSLRRFSKLSLLEFPELDLFLDLDKPLEALWLSVRCVLLLSNFDHSLDTVRASDLLTWKLSQLHTLIKF